MNGSYEAVRQALAAGTEPSALCATCPWNRPCVSPPEMNRGDIEARISESRQVDKQSARRAAAPGLGLAEQQAARLPVAELLTTAMFAGRDTAAQVCPVFALRLQSSGGRKLADGIRATMQGWDDSR